ncbi:MAG TPA: 6-carboxytetrahydropterin synthase QueD [Thermoanaerobaculia bacterium]|nr:6-carboxytetrahydropterin synthase QueD [Thermoanaerobaculia bacterium]
MHTIFKDFSFAAAHAIRGHTRGCENLHGHNYRVRVHLRARRLDALGMVLDFADLKAIVQEVLGPFDHRVLNEVPPFDERNTTAELLAQYVYDEVSKRVSAADENGRPARSNESGDESGGPGSERGGRAVDAGDDSGGEAGQEAAAAAALRDTGQRIWVVRVEVWENDTSCAAYEP